MSAQMGIEDWRALADHWKQKGHDLRLLEMPPDVAKELGIEIPERTMTMTEEQVENALMKWKKKKHFAGDFCGISKCKRPAEGYVMDIKPTKGQAKGQLWYGPACKKCCEASSPSLKPLSLEELAKQREGVSDLAMVLDTEIGDVKKRLKAAHIDEHGNRLPSHPSLQATEETKEPPKQTEIPETQEGAAGPYDKLAAVAAGAAPPAVGVAAIAELAKSTTVESEAVVIPVDKLAELKAEGDGVVAQLAPFHIMNQEQMDSAAGFLAEIKGKWKSLDTLRKELGEPLRSKLNEIRDHFKPALDSLAEAEKLLKQKISEGAARAQQAQQEALHAAQAALQQGDVQGTAIATQAAGQADVSLPAGVSQRMVIKFRIVDPSVLPGNFWSPDPKKVQGAIDMGYREIPGVEMWEEPLVSSTSKS